MENYNEFEDALKHHAGGFSMQPGAASFNAIQKKLQQKRRRRLGFIFLLTGTAAASLALIILFMLPANDSGVAKATEAVPHTEQVQKENAANTPDISYENKNYTDGKPTEANTNAIAPTHGADNSHNTKNKGSNKRENVITPMKTKTPQVPVFTGSVDKNEFGIDRERIEPGLESGTLADNGSAANNKTDGNIFDSSLKTDSVANAQNVNPRNTDTDRGNGSKQAWNKSRFALSVGAGMLISGANPEPQTTIKGCNCPSPNSVKAEGSTVLSETLKRYPQSGYSAGLAAEYRAGKRISVSLGINAWKMQQQQDFTYTETVYQPAYDIKNYFIDSNTLVRTADTSFSSSSSSVNYSTVVYTSFINVPLTVSYNFFPARRISLGVFGGASLSILQQRYQNINKMGTAVSQSVYGGLAPLAPAAEADPFESRNNSKEANINAVLGLQATYKINRWLGVYAAANTNFRAFSLRGNTDKSVQNPVLFGVNSGIKLFF